MSETEKAQRILEAIASNSLDDIDSLGFVRTVNTDKRIVWERKDDE